MARPRRLFALLLSLTLALGFTLSACGGAPAETANETETGKETQMQTETTNTQSESETEPAPAPIVLRVGTFNIRHGADVDLDYSVIAEDILACGLDVCGLQEVDEDTERNGHQHTMALLAEETGFYYAYTKAIDFEGGGYGTGILSRYPIVSFESFPLPSGDCEQRACGHAVIDVDGLYVDFFNTHLSFENAEIRGEQFAALAEEVNGLTCFIVTADFNTEDFTEFDVIEGAQPANNETRRLVSFHGEESAEAIDNILIPPAMTFLKIELDDEVSHSDHSMLWADVQLED